MGSKRVNPWFTEESKNSSLKKKIASDETNPTGVAYAEESRAQHFTRFAEGVNIGGVKYVVDGNANKVRRFVWLILVLGSLAFMVYQIQDRVRYFRLRPTTVDVRVNHNHSLLFPTVTICNENQVRRLIADHFHLTSTYQAFFPPYKLAVYQYPDFNLLPRGEHIDWLGLFTILAQPTNEAILEGQWKGAPINYTWFTPVWTDMGLCHQFNTEKQGFRVTRAGAEVGFKVLLYVDQMNYLKASSEAAGFRVLLHGAKEVPRMLNLGTKLSAGTGTAIAVTVKTVRSLPRPFGQCNNDPTYVKSQCDLKCMADYVIKTCKCREVYMPGDGVRICDLYDLFTCVNNARSEFVTTGVHEKCHCEPECHQIHYLVRSVSAAEPSNILLDFISEYSVKVFNFNASTKFVKENFSTLEIYMSDLSYEETITKEAYSILSLLCDVGGSLGLLLGSTLLTVFEIGDFLLVFFSRICCRTRVRKL